MSATLATDEWIAQIPELASDVCLGDFSGHVDVLITDAPGKIRFGLEIAEGRIVEASSGKAKDAAIGLEAKASIVAAVLREELDPAVAYMRGDIKLSEDYELALFSWRTTYQSDSWQAFITALNQATTFNE